LHSGFFSFFSRDLTRSEPEIVLTDSSGAIGNTSPSSTPPVAHHSTQHTTTAETTIQHNSNTSNNSNHSAIPHVRDLYNWLEHYVTASFLPFLTLDYKRRRVSVFQSQDAWLPPIDRRHGLWSDDEKRPLLFVCPFILAFWIFSFLFTFFG
jgi:hypothetical protein